MNIVDNILAIVLIAIFIGGLWVGFGRFMYGVSDPQNSAEAGKVAMQGCGIIIFFIVALIYNVASLISQSWLFL